MKDINKEWERLIIKLNAQLKEDLTLKGILYLIGVQELNMGVKNFNREEKLNVLHVAVCKILTPFGFYKFERVDDEGWPHWVELKPLKMLSNIDQEMLMKKAVLNYLNNN